MSIFVVNRVYGYSVFDANTTTFSTASSKNFSKKTKCDEAAKQAKRHFYFDISHLAGEPEEARIHIYADLRLLLAVVAMLRFLKDETNKESCNHNY